MLSKVMKLNKKHSKWIKTKAANITIGYRVVTLTYTKNSPTVIGRASIAIQGHQNCMVHAIHTEHACQWSSPWWWLLTIEIKASCMSRGGVKKIRRYAKEEVSSSLLGKLAPPCLWYKHIPIVIIILLCNLLCSLYLQLLHLQQYHWSCNIVIVYIFVMV